MVLQLLRDIIPKTIGKRSHSKNSKFSNLSTIPRTIEISINALLSSIPSNRCGLKRYLRRSNTYATDNFTVP